MADQTHTKAETDVLIVGAGPVGLFAVFALGMVRLRCHVVDSLDALGGQLTALYPTKPIYDIPGFSEVMAEDLVTRLIEQAQPFQPTYHLGATVESLTRAADGRWQAGLKGGSTISAPVVVIAGGAGAFGPTRPPLANIESYEGKSVFYLVRKREDFAGKRVVIAGGGDSAVDWAVLLADVAAKVTVVHRRAKFRCAPESEAKLKEMAKAGKVELAIPYQLHALEGANGMISAITLADLDGKEKKIEADMLLPFFGLAGDLGPIARWGLELNGHTIKIDPSTCATNLPGVFAVGDMVSYPGKLKLILQGFSEASMMAHAAYSVARPGTALHFEHSTTTGIPKL